ncbi:retrovirus-related pol polyprotein from transposon TNT 1-94 [Tanacetum coccineum]
MHPNRVLKASYISGIVRKGLYFLEILGWVLWRLRNKGHRLQEDESCIKKLGKERQQASCKNTKKNTVLCGCRKAGQNSEEERSSLKAKVLKARRGPSSSIIPKKATPSTSLVSDRLATSDTETINRSSVKWSWPDAFDIDLLTNSMNYEPVTTGNQTNKNTGIKDNVNAVPTQQYILLPLLYDSSQCSMDAVAIDAGKRLMKNQYIRVKEMEESYANNTNRDCTVSPSVSTARQNFTNANDLPTDPLILDLEDTGIFSGTYDDEDLHQKAEENKSQRLSKLLICLFSLTNRTQEGDTSFARSKLIEACQMNSPQFSLQKVWRLVDLPKGKHAIGTKWVYRNKKDKRGIVVRNKARVVTQGYTQEEGIDYDEVFAHVARIEAIRGLPTKVNKARAVMSSASSAVTYTSVYTDSEPGRVFWGADEELSDGGSPRVIVYGYDGLPMQPVAPPSPDYIPGPEEPQTPPVPQDEDEREPMFIQPHDPDYVPEPMYPEYIPLEDEHVFPAEEQPLPPVVSPTAESPGYVVESDPEEDPEEYEDDETEDGPHVRS